MSTGVCLLGISLPFPVRSASIVFSSPFYSPPVSAPARIGWGGGRAEGVTCVGDGDPHLHFDATCTKNIHNALFSGLAPFTTYNSLCLDELIQGNP